MGASPAVPKQAELSSAALLRVIDPVLLQLCSGRSPSCSRQPEFAMPGAAQELLATVLE